jgi:acyl-CoA thioesterase FadM
MPNPLAKKYTWSCCLAGIIRNLLTVLRALFSYASASPLSRINSQFWVTPFDTGLSKLKSDKYFQLAEAAQFDYMVKTGLIGHTLKHSIHFVNLAQMVKFGQPIALLSRVTVQSQVLYADDKQVYFSHALFAQGKQCAEVLVKMKFKQGAITVNPYTLLGPVTMPKPAALTLWDDALAAH